MKILKLFTNRDDIDFNIHIARGKQYDSKQNYPLLAALMNNNIHVFNHIIHDARFVITKNDIQYIHDKILNNNERKLFYNDPIRLIKKRMPTLENVLK